MVIAGYRRESGKFEVCVAGYIRNCCCCLQETRTRAMDWETWSRKSKELDHQGNMTSHGELHWCSRWHNWTPDLLTDRVPLIWERALDWTCLPLWNKPQHGLANAFIEQNEQTNTTKLPQNNDCCTIHPKDTATVHTLSVSWRVNTIQNNECERSTGQIACQSQTARTTTIVGFTKTSTNPNVTITRKWCLHKTTKHWGDGGVGMHLTSQIQHYFS